MTKNGDGIGLIAQLRSTRKPCRSLLHASAKPKTATSAPRSRRKAAGGDSCPMALFAIITELPLVLNSQITPKFVWQLKNLQKIKVVPNSKFYNFTFIIIPKFGLHFEMQV